MGSLTVETTHFSSLTSQNLKQAHFLGIVADVSRQINTLTNSQPRVLAECPLEKRKTYQ